MVSGVVVSGVCQKHTPVTPTGLTSDFTGRRGGGGGGEGAKAVTAVESVGYRNPPQLHQQS